MISYLVGSLFLSIFTFSATTILHCFILDEDTGGASGLTPASLVPFLEKYDAGNDKAKAEGGKDNQTGKEGGKANDMN